MQHKQALWDLYVVALKSNSDIQKKAAIDLCETLNVEQKWLIASFAFPHIDMRAGIASMNSKWINENAFDSLKSYESNDEKFDMIILDPPSFTKNKNESEVEVS